MPIAIHQTDANQQHYEVPNEFFKVILGPKLKYSSCIFEKADTTLTQATKKTSPKLLLTHISNIRILKANFCGREKEGHFHSKNFLRALK